jgi:hypothetical protein
MSIGRDAPYLQSLARWLRVCPHCLLVGTVDIAPTSLGTAPLGSVRLRLVCCPIQPSAGVFTQSLARKNRVHLRVGRPGAAMRHKESHFRITVTFEPRI